MQRHLSKLGPLLLVVSALLLASASLGCRDDGPAERLGRAFDDAATDLRDAVEEEVDQAMEAAEEAAEEASERLKEEASAAREKAHEAIDEAAGGDRS